MKLGGVTKATLVLMSFGAAAAVAADFVLAAHSGPPAPPAAPPFAPLLAGAIHDMVTVPPRQSPTMPDVRSGYVMVVDGDGHSECRSYGLGATRHGSPAATNIGSALDAGAPKERRLPNGCPEGNPECHSFID